MLILHSYDLLHLFPPYLLLCFCRSSVQLRSIVSSHPLFKYACRIVLSGVFGISHVRFAKLCSWIILSAARIFVNRTKVLRTRPISCAFSKGLNRCFYITVLYCTTFLQQLQQASYTFCDFYLQIIACFYFSVDPRGAHRKIPCGLKFSAAWYAVWRAAVWWAAGVIISLDAAARFGGMRIVIKAVRKIQAAGYICTRLNTVANGSHLPLHDKGRRQIQCHPS